MKIPGRTGNSLLFLRFFVGVDDLLYQSVTNDIGRSQATDGNILYPIQDADGILQSGHLVLRQVDLGHVTGNDDFGAEA